MFVTKPHLPAVGGAQLTIHFLAQELARRGNAITVFARQPPFDVPHSARGSDHGYLVIHSAKTSRDLRAVILEQAPDCVVVGGYHHEMATWVDAMLTACASLPTILYVHDVGGITGASGKSPRAHVVAAVSRFVADQLAQQGIESTVIPPIVDRSRYQVPTLRRVALFINPVEQKGLERALSMAEARPDIPFAFVRCWHIPPAELAQLRIQVESLGNVELRDSADDPARLYGDARVVLVPSTYPEAWGRVAAEAVAATIPVLATRIGGLPEAIGGGGILVDPEAPNVEWARQLGNIWDDPSVYEQQVARSEATASTRHDLSSASVGGAFEELVQRAIGASG